METLAQDIRFGLRSLWRTRGLTAVAALSLALGVMASTAIYSVVYGVVLEPFPYKDVDSLMSVRVSDPGQRGSRLYYTIDQFLEIAERSTIFEGVIASTISDVLWSGEREPQRLRGNFGTPNTFRVMGVPPAVGRFYNEGDAAPDAPAVAVLGYRFWQRQFAGDPNVVGRQMKLNGKVRTVVGVMPKRFMWRGADVYLPFVPRRGEAVENVRDVHLLGRLKRGVTEAQAEADLRPIIEELRRRDPRGFPEKFRVGLLSFKQTFPSSIREELWILFGAVGVLLLIACANVSNLLLSKSGARRKEMAIRASLGAGRGRLVRQLLTESLVLALGGSALGVALAWAALRAIIAIVPPGTIPDESEIAINVPVLLFSLGVCAFAAIASGLAPALHACTRELAAPLKETGRALTGGARQALLRRILVAGEVALALMLLISASLMMRTLVAVQRVQLGYDPDRILTMRVPLSQDRYPTPERRTAFLRDLMERIKAAPGVEAAGWNTWLHPFGNWNLPVEVPGAAQQDSRPVVLHQISDGYPAVYNMTLVRGRMLARTEIESRQPLALVNKALVRRHFGGGDPLGQTIRAPRLRQPPLNAAADSFQIVGVVEDLVNGDPVEGTRPELYVPYTFTAAADRLVVRAAGDAAALGPVVREHVYALDRDQPVMNVSTLARMVDEFAFAEPRFNFVLFGIFAALGLTLAVIGVYGVISQSVAQRTQEIGVRMALGALAGDIVRMVAVDGGKLLGVGIAVGLAGSWAVTRVLRNQVWSTSTTDPLTFTAVPLLMLAVGLAACLWPARRAARVNPVDALRYE
jgi:predicted permease